MNHLHVLLLPCPYAFDAVAVIALGDDVVVASEAFVVLVDALASLTLWILFSLTTPKVTICSFTV
jgi:hypothetical protein